MKKLIVIFLCLVLCLSLFTGCGAKKDKDDVSGSNDSTKDSLLTVKIDDYSIVLGKTLLSDILEKTKTVIVPDSTTEVRNEKDKIGNNNTKDVAVKVPSGKVIYLTISNPTDKELEAGKCYVKSFCVYGNPKDFSNVQSIGLNKVQFGMKFSEVQSVLGDPYVKEDIQGKVNVIYREGDFGYIYFTFSGDSLYAVELHNHDTY